MNQTIHLQSINLQSVTFVPLNNLGLDTRKLSSGFSNNKGADLPANPRRLISPFVIRSLEGTISKLTKGEISIFKLVSEAEEIGLTQELETPL